MNLFLRLLKVLFSAWRAPSCDLLDPDILSFRVWPMDLDLNIHMNNGRYLTVMDLGRIHLIGRTGLLSFVFKKKWTVAVGGASIQFRRPLKPFEKYHLKTQLLGWDEKWFYLRQVFEKRDGSVAASAIVRGLFRHQRRSIPSTEVLALLGKSAESPPLPPDLKFWGE